MDNLTDLSHAPVFGESRARSIGAEGPTRSEARKRDKFVVLFGSKRTAVYDRCGPARRPLSRGAGDQDRRVAERRGQRAGSAADAQHLR